MANTVAAEGNRKQVWSDKFFVEWLSNHPFKSYMGTKETDIIQVRKDLTKSRGDRMTFSLINALSGAANDGTSKLEGNEIAAQNRSHAISIGLRRTAVNITEAEQQASAVSLEDTARPSLMEWALQADTDRVISALYSKNGVAYGSATEAQKDAWLVDNADRCLFGAAKANNSGNDHSASLLNIDGVNDVLTPGALSLMKRMAVSAGPKIRPIRIGNNNKRYYVAFAHPLAFRDLKNNATMIQAQREVGLAKQNNKIFQGGDLEWDGIIIHEVDGMTTLAGVGAAGIDVGGVFLCGAQAFGMAIAKPFEYRFKSETDYGNETGVGIVAQDGLEKMIFGTGANDTDDLKDNGVVTGYFAAVADT